MRNASDALRRPQLWVTACLGLALALAAWAGSSWGSGSAGGSSGSASAVAAASSRTVKMTAYDGVLTGIKLTAKLKGSPFGRGRIRGVVEIPNSRQTWKFKNGTIKLTGHTTTGAADHSKGTWKITGGTGKYRGARGKATFDGYFSRATFKYKGKVRY